jgi:hypothetical protein
VNGRWTPPADDVAPPAVVTVVQPARRLRCDRARLLLSNYLDACADMGLPADTSLHEFVSHCRAAGATALLLALRARDQRAPERQVDGLRSMNVLPSALLEITSSAVSSVSTRKYK